MPGEWYQLFVKAPEGSGYNTPQTVKRIDDHLTQQFPVMFKCPPPSGLPIQEPDGTWEVRVMMKPVLSIVKRILTEHYGLVIVREVENASL